MPTSTDKLIESTCKNLFDDSFVTEKVYNKETMEYTVRISRDVMVDNEGYIRYILHSARTALETETRKRMVPYMKKSDVTSDSSSTSTGVLGDINPLYLGSVFGSGLALKEDIVEKVKALDEKKKLEILKILANEYFY